MKHFYFLAALLLSVCASAQQTPIGASMSAEELAQIATIPVQSFDHTQLAAEDDEFEKNGGMAKYARIVPMELDLAQAGTWTTLENGTRVLQVRFASANAQGIGVLFSNFNLPEGATCFIYRPDMKHAYGPFDFSENKPSGRFRLAEVIGNEAIVEVQVPATCIAQPMLIARGVFYAYRMMPSLEELNTAASDPCEVDVKCPEGNDWVEQRQAVVRLSIVAGASGGLCSGSMVNNTSGDCKNYVLTAFHCTVDITNPLDYNDMQVFFNYQRSGCGTGVGTLSQFKTGVDPIANAADGGGNTGADFALVEMQQVPSLSWNVFYSGWDASGTAPTYGIGIHHPSGDFKKISRAGTVVSGTWAVAGYHWRVTWVQTETNWGVTEPGSSGSPLFNQNHQLIGTLTGGGSYCDTPSANDFYGKFSKQWNHANNTNTTTSANYWNMPTHMLSPWLDPTTTGATSMNGSYKVSGSCVPAVISVPELSFDRTTIYPTLASEILSITTQEFDRIQNVKVYDSRGMLMESFRLSGDKTEVNVSGYASGVYYVSFLGTGGDHLTQKFTVIH